MTRISDRISRDVGVKRLVELLGEQLSPTDPQSLLLEVFRVRARRRSPADVLRRFEDDRFVKPSGVDPRLVLAFDQLAFSLAAPPFAPIELSLVAPFGVASAVTPLDQNPAVATIRNTEVISDSPNVLALEEARRRRELTGGGERTTTVRLCSTQRLLRAQSFDDPSCGRISASLGSAAPLATPPGRDSSWTTWQSTSAST